MDVKKFLTKSLTIAILFALAAVNGILLAAHLTLDWIVVIDLILVIGIGLLYFDDRIEKLEKWKKSFNKRLKKKGFTPLITFIIFLLIILLIIALTRNQPLILRLSTNITKIP